MAVVKMKLVSIAGPIKEFDHVVRDCITDHGFHIENTLSILPGIDGLFAFEQTNPYGDLLKKAVAVCERMGVEPDYRPFDQNSETHVEAMDYLTSLEKQYSSLSSKLDHSRKTIADDEKINAQLTHLHNLSMDIHTFFNLTYVKFRFGRIPKDTYKVYAGDIESNENVFFMPTSIETDYVYGMYMIPRKLAETADALMASFSFERIRISDRVQGTPEAASLFLSDEKIRLQSECSSLESEVKALLFREKDNLLSRYAYAKYMHDTYDIRRYSAHTQKSFYTMGWVNADDVEEFTDRLDLVEEISYTIDDPAGLPGIFTPPSRLKSFPLFKPFQEFIRIYGLPNYTETDPTPFLAITYPLLFGIMFGDVGQGLVLFIASLLYWKLKKNPLAPAITIASVSSIIFGFVYGSVFGNEEILGFGFHALKTSANTNKMLLLAVALGILLMSVGMGINVANGIRQKNVMKAVFDSHGIAGFIFYWSVLIAVILLFLSGKNILTPIYIIVLIVVPLLLIFLREPLTAFVRKNKWAEQKKGDYFLTSLFELVEVVISFLSNTISFIRVGAFALSHAGMMMVVYTLSRSFGNSDNIVVIIIGNLFVMALEGLIVGIQVLRLEFYELFGKFYAGNGKPCSDISIQYKLNTQRR